MLSACGSSTCGAAACGADQSCHQECMAPTRRAMNSACSSQGLTEGGVRGYGGKRMSDAGAHATHVPELCSQALPALPVCAPAPYAAQQHPRGFIRSLSRDGHLVQDAALPWQTSTSSRTQRCRGRQAPVSASRQAHAGAPSAGNTCHLGLTVVP